MHALLVFIAFLLLGSCTQLNSLIQKPQSSSASTITDITGNYMLQTDLALHQEAEFKDQDAYPCVIKNSNDQNVTVLNQSIFTNAVAWFFTCYAPSLSAAKVVLARVLMTRAMQTMKPTEVATIDREMWLTATSSAIGKLLNQEERISLMQSMIVASNALGLPEEYLSYVSAGMVAALDTSVEEVTLSAIKNMSHKALETVNSTYGLALIKRFYLLSTSSVASVASLLIKGMMSGLSKLPDPELLPERSAALLGGAFSVDFGADTGSILQTVISASLVNAVQNSDNTTLVATLNSIIVGLCSGLQELGQSCSSYWTDLNTAKTIAQTLLANVALPDFSLCPDDSGIEKNSAGKCLFTSDKSDADKTASTDSTETEKITPVDTSPPTLVLMTPATAYLNALPSTVTATFSEAMIALTSASFVISGNCSVLPTVTGVSMSSDKTAATATLSGGVCSEGQYTYVAVSPSAQHDLAGNAGSAMATTKAYTLARTAPIVSLGTPSATLLRSASATTIALAFAQSVAGGTALTGILNSAGAGIILNTKSGNPSCTVQATSITTNGASLTLSSCSGNGTLAVQAQAGIVTDSINNHSVASGESTMITVDNTAPSVTALTPSSSYVNPVPSSIIATFSESVVSLTTGKFTLGGNCTTMPTVTSVTMSSTNTVATATLSGGTCSNTQMLTVTVDPSTISDTAGNSGSGSAVMRTYTVTTTGPSASLASPSSTLLRSATSATIALTYTAGMAGSLALAGTLTSAGGGLTITTVSGNPSCTKAVSSISTSGATITLSSCSGNGTLTVHVNAGTLVDGAGNSSTVSGESSVITVDNSAPTVSSSSPSNGQAIFSIPTSLTVTFSEAVTVSSSNFIFSSGTCGTNPSVSSVSGSGTTMITVNVTGGTCANNTTVVLTSTLSAISDSAGNAGSGTSTVSLRLAKRIFVTSTQHNGNFGGVSGADSYCASDNNKPSTGTYKAMLTDASTRIACTSAWCGGGSSEHSDWVLGASSYYARTDGTAIGTTNSVGIFIFPVTAGIGTNGFVNGKMWTGFDMDNRTWVARSNCSCSSWGTSSSGTNGCYGVDSDSDDNMIDYYMSACNNTYRLFCVEQ